MTRGYNHDALGGRPAACAGALASDLHYSKGLAMKRLLVLVAVLVPLSFFVVGCGGSGGSSDKASQEKVVQKNMEDQSKMMQEKMKKGMKAGEAAKY
jgi:hypothetical protein